MQNAVQHSPGKSLRTHRLVDRAAGTILLIPLDHSVADGPITSATGFRDIVESVARNGADAVLVHKGRVRFLPMEVFRDVALIVHLNGGTRHAPDANAKVLLAEVAEAVQLGADAVSIHVNMGSETESQQLADLAKVAEGCVRWGIPLVAMVYPRGPHVTDPTDPDLVAHAASIAADLGADLVKIPYTGSIQTMAEVVRGCPIPIVTAGGTPLGDDDLLVKLVDDVMASGALGVAMGRNVFQSTDASRTVRRLAEVVHSNRYRHTGSLPDAGPME